MSFESGKIEEFTTAPIHIEIFDESDPNNKFVLTIRPTVQKNLFTVACNNLSIKYNGSTAQVRQHIMDALEIARISMYAHAHRLILRVPYYPNLSIPVDKMETALPLINRVLDNYM